MADKKYRSITVAENTAKRLEAIKGELIAEQKETGLPGADKMSLGDIVDTAISFWYVRRKNAEGPVLRSKR